MEMATFSKSTNSDLRPVNCPIDASIVPVSGALFEISLQWRRGGLNVTIDKPTAITAAYIAVTSVASQDTSEVAHAAGKLHDVHSDRSLLGERLDTTRTTTVLKLLISVETMPNCALNVAASIAMNSAAASVTISIIVDRVRLSQKEKKTNFSLLQPLLSLSLLLLSFNAFAFASL